MEAAAQREVDLHKNTGASLNQAGYEVTPQFLNPDDQGALENIKESLGEAVHIVGSGVEERLMGKGPETHDRVSPGERFSHWVSDRIRRKKK